MVSAPGEQSLLFLVINRFPSLLPDPLSVLSTVEFPAPAQVWVDSPSLVCLFSFSSIFVHSSLHSCRVPCFLPGSWLLCEGDNNTVSYRQVVVMRIRGLGDSQVESSTEILLLLFLTSNPLQSVNYIHTIQYNILSQQCQIAIKDFKHRFPCSRFILP